MESLYESLEHQKVSIMESPTGTGKSLSILVSSLLFLTTKQQQRPQELERALENISGKEDDWVGAQLKREKLLSEIAQLEKFNSWKQKIFSVLEHYRGGPGLSLPHHPEEFPKSTKRRRKDPLCSDELEEFLLHSDREPSGSDAEVDADEPGADPHPLEASAFNHLQQGMKIFYTSRTHSQLSQFLEQMKITTFKNSVLTVVLGSRKQLCVNSEVSSLPSLDAINESCKELRKQRKCPYSTADSRSTTFLEAALAHIHTIDELFNLGKMTGCCPYYGGRHLSRIADLVVLPYQLLLDPETRHALNLEIDENIIIIDEAHNVIDTIADIYSSTLPCFLLETIITQLTTYKQKFSSRLAPRNMKYVKQLLFLATTFLTFLNKNTPAAQLCMELNDFLFRLRIDNYNFFKITTFITESHISRKVSGYIEFHEKQPNCNKMPIDTLHRFLLALSYVNSDGRVLVSGQDHFTYLLLNPEKHFRTLCDGPSSVILAGGTMAPHEMYTTLIPPERRVFFSCNHIVSREHVCASIISTGPTGKPLSFNYSNRTNTEMLNELGNCLLNLFRIVPKGLVVFFPSHEYLKTVISHLKTTPLKLFESMQRKKNIFVEQGDIDSLLQKYKAHVSNGAALFAVVGGRLSEGINFEDELARAVIMVSLPYPNPHDIILREKLAFKKRENPLFSNTEYLQNLCMKGVNQSIGRAIRHKNDYSAIILIDSRFLHLPIIKKLPTWIQDSLTYKTQNGTIFNFGQNVSHIASFFRNF